MGRRNWRIALVYGHACAAFAGGRRQFRLFHHGGSGVERDIGRREGDDRCFDGGDHLTPTVTAALGHALTDTLTVTDTDKLGVTTTSTATFIMDGGVLARYPPHGHRDDPGFGLVSVTQGVAGADAFSLQSSQGHYGTATIDPTSGVVTFTETTAPAAGTAPTQTFIVFIKDPEGVTTTATASFVVDGGASVNYTTPAVEGNSPVTNTLAVTSGVAGSDTYSLASTQGAYGTASINPSTGLVTYTETTAPAPGTAPSDTFSVLIKDSEGVTTTATASFVVDGGTSANYGPPEVASGNLIITPVLVSPEGGDTFKLVSSQGVYGNASIASSTGAITYAPTASAALGQPLTDTFTVTDTDKLGVTTTSTVTVILEGGLCPRASTRSTDLPAPPSRFRRTPRPMLF